MGRTDSMDYSRAFRDAVNEITYLKGKYLEGQENGDQGLCDWAFNEAEKQYAAMAQESPQHADMMRNLSYDTARLYNRQVNGVPVEVPASAPSPGTWGNIKQSFADIPKGFAGVSPMGVLRDIGKGAADGFKGIYSERGDIGRAVNKAVNPYEHLKDYAEFAKGMSELSRDRDEGKLNYKPPVRK